MLYLCSFLLLLILESVHFTAAAAAATGNVYISSSQQAAGGATFYNRVRKYLPVIHSFRTVSPAGKQIHQVKLERTYTESGKIATTLSLSRKSKNELFPKDAESVVIVASPTPPTIERVGSMDGISQMELERMYSLLRLKKFYTQSSRPQDLVRIYNRIQPGCLKMLTQCIPVLKSSYGWENQLTLRNKGLTDRDVEVLSMLLPKLVTVKSLDLSGNRIGDRGSVAMATVLKTSPHIDSLDLSRNQIKDQGMDAIARSLLYSSISTIKLRNNHAKTFNIPLPF